MHTVFALLCFVVVIHWLIFPYPSGLLHWHCGNLTIAPVPAKQPRWIWINTSCEFIMNDCITTTKQSTTYVLGYTVLWMPLLLPAICTCFCHIRLHMFVALFTTLKRKEQPIFHMVFPNAFWNTPLITIPLNCVLMHWIDEKSALVWVIAKQVVSHYLNQWWHSSLAQTSMR